MVSSHCLIIKGQPTVDAGKSLHSVEKDNQKTNYSGISVVREIAHRTVLPYVVMCSDQQSSRSHSMSLLRGIFHACRHQLYCDMI